MNDGGPAYPTEREEAFIPVGKPGEFVITGSRVVTYPGMSLLDYFAGQAMGAICHVPITGNVDQRKELRATAKADNMSVSQWLAFQSYGMAESMLAERERLAKNNKENK